MANDLMNELRRRMDGALEALNREFGGLRTGRASAHLLDPVVVKAYGSDMPLVQVGTVNVPESRLGFLIPTAVHRLSTATMP